MRFQLLGEVGAASGGHFIPLGRLGARLLVELLREAGNLVPAERLIDALYDDEPAEKLDKKNQRQALHAQIKRLKEYLDRVEPGAADALVPRSENGGYRLMADRADVDLHRFRRLATRAKALATRPRGNHGDHLDHGDDAELARLSRAALLEWGGGRVGIRGCEPMIGVGGRRVAGYRQGLRKEHRELLVEYLAAELRLGAGARFVTDLDELHRIDPLDQRILRCLMHAHVQAGNPARAIDAYERLLERLERLGRRADTAITPETRRLHERIAHHDPTLLPPPDSPPSDSPPSDPASNGADMRPPEILALAQRATDVLAPALPYLNGADVPRGDEELRGISWVMAKAVWQALHRHGAVERIPEAARKHPDRAVLRAQLAAVLVPGGALASEISAALTGEPSGAGAAHISVAGHYFHQGDNITGTSIKYYNG